LDEHNDAYACQGDDGADAACDSTLNGTAMDGTDQRGRCWDG
jgi:hypothetical protein